MANYDAPRGGTGPSGPRASFGIRFVAALIDSVILGVVSGVLQLVLGRALAPPSASSPASPTSVTWREAPRGRRSGSGR